MIFSSLSVSSPGWKWRFQVKVDSTILGHPSINQNAEIPGLKSCNYCTLNTKKLHEIYYCSRVYSNVHPLDQIDHACLKRKIHVPRVSVQPPCPPWYVHYPGVPRRGDCSSSKNAEILVQGLEFNKIAKSFRFRSSDSVKIWTSGFLHYFLNPCENRLQVNISYIGIGFYTKNWSENCCFWAEITVFAPIL